MTAQEAKKLAREIQEANIKVESENVMAIINHAVKQGELSTYCYGSISSDMQLKLQDLGYQVTCCSNSRDGDQYKISWIEVEE